MLLTMVDHIFLPLLLLLVLLFGLEDRTDHGDRVEVPVDGMPASPGGLLLRRWPLRSSLAVIRGSRGGGRRGRRDGRPVAARSLGESLMERGTRGQLTFSTFFLPS